MHFWARDHKTKGRKTIAYNVWNQSVWGKTDRSRSFSSCIYATLMGSARDGLGILRGNNGVRISEYASLICLCSIHFFSTLYAIVFL